MRAFGALAILVLGILLAAACSNDVSDSPMTATPAPIATAIPPTPSPTATPEPTHTPTPEPTPTFEPERVTLPAPALTLEIPTRTPPFPDDLDRALDAIRLKASVVRDLSALSPVESRLVSSEEMRQSLADDFAEESESLEIADRLYTILGILDSPDTLSDILLDVYSSVVIGKYESDENALLVVSDMDAFTPANELTAAHEFVHSLQQQHFDIGGLRDSVEDNSDRTFALRALIEGDASIAEFIYMRHVFDQRDQRLAQEESQAADLSSLLAAPTFVQRRVMFPYNEGWNFAVTLYQLNGDFTALDMAYEDPPASTEQIIHPELYGRDFPVEVEAPDVAGALGDGWTELERDVMGELFFSAMRQDTLGPERAGAAAAGWGGDAYVLLEDLSGAAALASISAWDTEEDASEFAEALMDYFGSLAGGEWIEREAAEVSAHRLDSSNRIAVDVRSRDDTVWLTVAADAETLEAALPTISQ